jgi:hypothetical protein
MIHITYWSVLKKISSNHLRRNLCPYKWLRTNRGSQNENSFVVVGIQQHHCHCVQNTNFLHHVTSSRANFLPPLKKKGGRKLQEAAIINEFHPLQAIQFLAGIAAFPTSYEAACLGQGLPRRSFSEDLPNILATQIMVEFKSFALIPCYIIIYFKNLSR